ncbi:MAG: hypothetical protein KDA28_14785 [Phycisphaerales bacterium]|nr:hypothetical protein [Phycisphaerales bacterium]
MSIPRAAFDRRTALAAIPVAMVAPMHSARGATSVEDEPVAALWPTQDADLARQVVGASHANLDLVRDLVSDRPALAKAAWDWGFGDWETALGAASHTGRREIAEFLIAHGARPDLFTFAMFDQVDVLRPLLVAMPDLAGLPGPHGITLRRHAEAGGAARVLDLLESFPASNRGPSSLPVTETEGDTMLGTYRFGPRSDGVLVIERNRQGDLAIRRGTFSSRVLHRVEADSLTFAPAGSPAVRIRLQGDTLTVIDGRFSLAASRQTGG